jgi:glycine cleavage system H protein
MASKIDPTARYLKTHEWARLEGEEVVCGISDHAQDALGDIVFVELPRVGASFKAGEPFSVVESVKAASDVYIPVGGVITDTNTALESDQAIINKDPYQAGWLIKLKPDNPADFDALLDASAYEQLLKEEEGH